MASSYIFPDIEKATEEGLLAIGGDLEPETLINAYSHGIFPWFSENDPIMWWSLSPRLILYPQKIHISKSLQRVIKSKKFEVTFDTQFAQVIQHCATIQRDEGDETWITKDMTEAYIKLHELGLSHSVEVWQKGTLVGGLYGVSIGKAFFGESMFHKVSDASKVALVLLSQKLKEWSFLFIDAQMVTKHLVSMGAIEIPRKEFKTLLQHAMEFPTRQGVWS